MTTQGVMRAVSMTGESMTTAVVIKATLTITANAMTARAATKAEWTLPDEFTTAMDVIKAASIPMVVTTTAQVVTSVEKIRAADIMTRPVVIKGKFDND